jgi:hypothetical protein
LILRGDHYSAFFFYRGIRRLLLVIAGIAILMRVDDPLPDRRLGIERFSAPVVDHLGSGPTDLRAVLGPARFLGAVVPVHHCTYASRASGVLLFPANRLSSAPKFATGAGRWSSKGTVGADDGSERQRARRGFRSVISVTPSCGETDCRVKGGGFGDAAMLRNLRSNGLYDERMIDRKARSLTIAFAAIVLVWMLAYWMVSVSAQVGAQSHHMAESAASIEK